MNNVTKRQCEQIAKMLLGEGGKYVADRSNPEVLYKASEQDRLFVEFDEAGTKIVATACLWPLRGTHDVDKSGGRWEIGTCHTAEGYRGRGYGRKLARKAFDRADPKECVIFARSDGIVRIAQGLGFEPTFLRTAHRNKNAAEAIEAWASDLGILSRLPRDTIFSDPGEPAMYKFPEGKTTRYLFNWVRRGY